MANDDYALLVGINHYPDIRDLEGPENDIQAFYDWLIDPNGGGIDPAEARQRIKVVRSSDFSDPSHPTENEIDDLLKDWVKKAANEERVGRRLYLYLAGHGIEIRENPAAQVIPRASLLTANGSRLRPGAHILGADYAAAFRNSWAFDEVVLFMDCCREDIGAVERRPFPFILPPQGSIAETKPLFMGFAALKGKKAREEALGERGKVHGRFTWDLLRALRHAAGPGGKVTASALVNLMHNQKLPNPALGDQIPKFDLSPVGADLELGLAAGGFRVILEIGAQTPAPVELIDGSLNSLEALPSDSKRTLSLAKGLYGLRPQGLELRLFQVTQPEQLELEWEGGARVRIQIQAEGA